MNFNDKLTDDLLLFVLNIIDRYNPDHKNLDKTEYTVTDIIEEINKYDRKWKKYSETIKNNIEDINDRIDIVIDSFEELEVLYNNLIADKSELLVRIEDDKILTKETDLTLIQLSLYEIDTEKDWDIFVDYRLKVINSKIVILYKNNDIEELTKLANLLIDFYYEAPHIEDKIIIEPRISDILIEYPQEYFVRKVKIVKTLEWLISYIDLILLEAENNNKNLERYKKLNETKQFIKEILNKGEKYKWV